MAPTPENMSHKGYSSAHFQGSGRPANQRVHRLGCRPPATGLPRSDAECWRYELLSKLLKGGLYRDFIGDYYRGY